MQLTKMVAKFYYYFRFYSGRLTITFNPFTRKIKETLQININYRFTFFML